MVKKKVLLTLSVVALGIASYTLLKPVIAETTIGKTNENQTISIYKNLLKGKSEKEINDYFSGLSDSKLIIADKSGGFTTSSTDDYSNPVETIDENGNKIPTEPYDPLGFAWQNCTSYAAFAVRKYTPHADFRNDWKGSSFGDAKHWHVTAESLSIHVDEVPTVGSVAERTSGKHGHVAFVVAVNSDGSFVVNEYNHVKTLGFSSRTARFGEESDQFSKFIHFENPPPS